MNTFILNLFILLHPWKNWVNLQLSTGLLPDTQNHGLRMRRESREHFPRHLRLAIPTCITARAWRMCRDACRDRQLAVSFDVDGGKNLSGIPSACVTRNFTYLVRGTWPSALAWQRWWSNPISFWNDVGRKDKGITRETGALITA